MKKLLAIALLSLMVGCTTTVPVTMKWPSASDEMLAQPADLTPLPEDKRTLTDLIENSNDNYAQYYILKEKYEGWQNWYNGQQKIWQGLK